MNAATESPPERGLEILRKVNAILDAFETHGELTVPELSTIVEEPASSLYRLLTSMIGTGWLETSRTWGRYRLGLEMMRIGNIVEDRVDVRDHARPILEELNQKTGLTVYLCVRRFTRSVCIERFEGRDVRSLATLVGSSTPLYAGAAPRVLFGALPEAERERVAFGDFRTDPFDPPVPTPQEMLADVAQVASQGYAISDGDVTPGVAAIGAPIHNHRGDVGAAISLSGLRRDVISEESERLVSWVREGAAHISAALGYTSEDEDENGR